jgi:hypothetical protein
MLETGVGMVFNIQTIISLYHASHVIPEQGVVTFEWSHSESCPCQLMENRNIPEITRLEHHLGFEALLSEETGR